MNSTAASTPSRKRSPKPGCCCSCQPAASAASSSAAGIFLTAYFMKLGANPFRRAFPGLKDFRVLLNFPETAFQFRADFGMNLIVILRIEDFVFVLVKPVGEAAALFARQVHQSRFNLFHAHGDNLRFSFWFANEKIERQFRAALKSTRFAGTSAGCHESSAS